MSAGFPTCKGLKHCLDRAIASTFLGVGKIIGQRIKEQRLHGGHLITQIIG